MIPTLEPTSAHCHSVCNCVGVFLSLKQNAAPSGRPGANPQLPPRGAVKRPPERPLTRPHQQPLAKPSEPSLSPDVNPARPGPPRQLLFRKLSPSYPCFSLFSPSLSRPVFRELSLFSVSRLRAKGGLESLSRAPSQPSHEPWHPLALFCSTSNILVTGVIELGGWPPTT